MDNAARAAMIRIASAMTDAEWTDFTTQARGGNDWTPSPGDYQNLVAELEGETREGLKSEAGQALRDHLQHGGD